MNIDNDGTALGRRSLLRESLALPLVDEAASGPLGGVDKAERSQ